MSLFRFLSTVACRKRGTAGLSHYLETGWYPTGLTPDEGPWAQSGHAGCHSLCYADREMASTIHKVKRLYIYLATR